MTLKTVALTRIVTKTAHLPATTALGSIDVQDYRVQGLKAGANVLMPNFTPQPYRQQYEIYPGKRCVNEPVGACSCCMEGMAASIGRHIDHCRGDAVRTGERNSMCHEKDA
jgi:biotin synthase